MQNRAEYVLSKLIELHYLLGTAVWSPVWLCEICYI